jgi:TPR repeat protein
VQGEPVAQDFVEAARLWGLAAAQGDAAAQYNLGLFYAEGKGVAQDFVEAARLWRLAAAQGYAVAQLSLGALDAAQGLTLARTELSNLLSERGYVSACCIGCGATRKLKTCTKGKVARLCGTECARWAWPEHKPHCKRWEAYAVGEPCSQSAD